MADASATVLIGYDGSEDAARAIEIAARLLRPRRAIVAYAWRSFVEMLLRADVEGLRGPLSEPPRELHRDEAELAERVARQGAEIARASGLDATPLAVKVERKAWRTLLDVADQQEAAAIVVGSRGLGGVTSVLLGSVSSGVLHHARVPVLVVPPGTRSEREGPLLIGYDGSEHSDRAVSAAARLLAVREALVATFWLPYQAVAPADVVGMGTALMPRLVEEFEAASREWAEETAERGRKLAAELGLEARGEAIPAPRKIWREILEEAERHTASAIVVGSHGRSSVGAAVLGSVARALLHHTSFPLLVARPER